MTRLSELTKTRVEPRRQPEPEPLRRASRPTTRCSTARSSWRRTPGTIGFSDTEVERLRDYLLKGGFFWVDDFWGTRRLGRSVESQIAQVLPPSEFPIEDVRARRSDAARACIQINHIPQITNIQFWRRTGGAAPPSAAPTATWCTCA